VGVTGYKVFRAGTQVGTSSAASFADTGLTASTSYSYIVSAFDAAGNNSAQSAGASATTLSSGGGGGGTIPPGLGWFDIPNTKMQQVCPTYPDIQAVQGCAGIVTQWGSGLADTTRNRMVIWGGGHSGYYGNEVYSVNLNNNPITISLLRDASHGAALGNLSSCPDAWLDGTPTPKHTGGALQYLPNQDVYWTHGWGDPACGGFGNGKWMFSPITNGWTARTTADPQPHPNTNGSEPAEAYDPVTGNIFDVEANNGPTFWSYNYNANAWTNLSSSWACLTTAMHGTIDPIRRLYFCAGGGSFNSISLNPPYTVTNLNGTNCNGVGTANGPAMEYDPTQQKFVIWMGGNTVYIYNPDTDSCTSQTYPNGPGAAQPNGTYGRFRYFPSLGVFVVVNNVNQDAFSLRLTAGGGGTGPSGPSINGVSVSSITTTGGTVNWTTDVAATSQVEYGTTIAYGTLTTVNSSLVTSHSVALSGLTINTLYHYRVHSKNSAGTETISGDFAFQTNNTADTTPPTVSITAPANGATVSGTVTVSANASDNVGVASVQFLVDGVNAGTALTSAPYTFSWNTTAAANGSHALTAKASDAAGNVATAVGVTVTVSNTTGNSTALQDFQTRCATTGVIVCQSFDSASVFGAATFPGSGLYPGDDGVTIGGTQDTSTSRSGTGSLKFTVPSFAGSNPAGYWRQLFTSGGLSAGPSTATVFAQNSTFYVQYAQRFSPEYLTNQWPSSSGGTTWWKQQIISSDQSTCGNIELSTINAYNNGFPQMYSQCGQDLFNVGIGNSDLLLEQGDTGTTGYNCHYLNPTPQTCFFYPSNKWVTFYYKVQIGTWGQPNSTIQAWVSVDGQPYKEWVNMPNHILKMDANLPAYNTVTLLPYMTGRNPAVSAGPVSYTWYDELIVSTQPIAAPTTTPALP
jgi:hypothetical protein